MSKAKCAILAGNSRVSVNDDGTLQVEPQLGAFRVGLRRAVDLENAGVDVRLSIAIDHRGRFAEQFLPQGLNVRARRRPRLGQVLPALRAPFEPVAAELGVPLDRVLVLQERTARLRSALLGERMPEIRAALLVPTSDDEDPPDLDPRWAPSDGAQATCAAVALAYYERAAQGCPRLEVYFEDLPWSRPGVLQRGAALAHRLGHPYLIRCVLVGEGDAMASSSQSS